VGELDELQSGDPKRIGPYRLEARLGTGGMGRVYLGRSPGGRYVAIKVIRADLAEDADFRARFAREATAARKVSGIFTASVVDADLDGPVPWLATAYIAGPSLTDAVAAHGPLPAPSLLRLAAGLAEGLQAIHSAGVVHRDLKPSNVLLADDGPRLIDFGISRSIETTALTRTGMVVGSPGFMSPEQAEGRDVGPPSDIFSLGGVLAFAATGEGPFGDGPTAALLYRVVRTEPDTARLPAEIRPVIERCLAKDPRQRPTAAQLLAGLSDAQPAAYLPPEPAHPATELAAAPVPGRGETPDGPLAASRPEPRPGCQEQVTQTQRHRDRPAAAQETSFDRPTAQPVPPWDGLAPEPAPAWDRPTAEPVRRQPPRRGWLVVAAAAAVLASVAAGVFLAGKTGHAGSGAPASSSGSPQAHSSPPGSAAATGTPGAAAMATLGSYLTQSASVRPTIQNAIDGVEYCSESPASAEATLRHAITTRQGILNGLRTLSVSGLPYGPQLVSTLTTAMQDSIAADQDYLTWMDDFASSGSPCRSDPNQDSYYAAAVTASNAATIAKNAFVAIWNPMAPRYGQPPYSDTGF